ncbi:PH domain-containing protein [Bacillus sp. HMF5848]|uniref:PH domain-containing protein n=1 Tax=Bacillus sp. HMF5848 TaxID=2495421 RepID=UPI000F7BA59D|nr:PH domain-containing protein [Bacillus sp. HMF5848]RSK29063.1 PH domain-containing protein [Bacillus sp. HMF5848]
MADVYAKIVGLSEVHEDDGLEIYDFLLLEDEEVLLSYKSIRDRLVITDSKLIIINVQGLTGKKKEYMVIPFSKISAFSVESAGSFDLDAELKIYASGINQLELQLTKHTDVRPLAALLSQAIS